MDLAAALAQAGADLGGLAPEASARLRAHAAAAKAAAPEVLYRLPPPDGWPPCRAPDDGGAAQVLRRPRDAVHLFGSCPPTGVIYIYICMCI